MVADLYAERIPWLYSGLTVDRGYLKNNRDALVRFLKATIEGNHLALTDEKRAKEMLAKRTQAHRSEDHRPELRQLQSRDAAERRDRPHGRREHPHAIAPANASQNLDDYIDTSLTDGLRTEGFMDAMVKKYGK